MLRHGSEKQIKILVSKALYRIVLSLACLKAIEEFFSDSVGTCGKKCDFWAKPSSLWITFFGILDPKIPRFVDSAGIFTLD